MSYQWLIPDMFWPTGADTPAYVSHESICVLNTSDADATINITLFFENEAPAILQPAHCGAKRAAHIRMDKIKTAAGAHIQRGVPYAACVESNVNLAVQYSRLDTNANCTLMTTIL
ncbi:MAG: sensory rhodopsin transducer [Ruthenibacterium sp.]